MERDESCWSASWRMPTLDPNFRYASPGLRGLLRQLGDRLVDLLIRVLARKLGT